jgi:hypothetical protein
LLRLPNCVKINATSGDRFVIEQCRLTIVHGYFSELCITAHTNISNTLVYSDLKSFVTVNAKVFS